MINDDITAKSPSGRGYGVWESRGYGVWEM
jgi:hypothetical protein